MFGFLSACSLVGSLTSELQNGNSSWGLSNNTRMSPWIVDNGINSEGKNNCPWGSRTAKDNNPYTDAPETGITRHYEWNITRRVIAPDGYQKNVILINDQFPGPLLEANWGDWIEVTVNNNIENVDEGTSIHWHGMIQQGTPFMDGVPGVTQCPIPTGGSFTYKFHASIYGSSWYHSHYSAQYSDGLYGPLVIHGPSQQQYDIDVGPILVGDWWHKSYLDVVDEIMAPNFTGRSFSDNNLIQGKMNFNCSTKAAGDNTVCTNNAGLAKFTFTPGKVHRLRLVNTGSQGIERISIDGHTMTVIANDFVEVEPYSTNVITLGVGQRTDVLVVADNKDTSAFWFRANLTSCSGANQPLAVAAVYYEGADTAAVPTSTAWDSPDPGNCANDDLSTTAPLYPIAIPEPSFTHEMDIGVFVNETGNFLWTFGNVSARVDYNAPTLLQVKAGNLTFAEIDNVINFGTNTSVRIVVKNPTPAPHPMHAHGLNMYVLAEGDGEWDGSTIIRANNPQRRDVQNIRPNGYIVVQMDTTNTGVWPFHCHIAWHASAGFFSQLLFQPDEFDRIDFPASIQQTCDAWNSFTTVEVPDQIDSGL